MCGICGWGGTPPFDGGEDPRAVLGRMCRALAHRGPDEEGRWHAPGIALGMRRLSIIDVQGGHQPIANEDQSVRVVFNGEIYNHHPLRKRLLDRGHTFTTRSDTETLVHLYEDHGDALVQHLRGMFTFALWDARRARLVLARDRLGIKPLYYWDSGRGLIFASELRALVTLDAFPRRLDPDGVGAYLRFGYVPDPLSIFAGVRKLPPGHVLTWSMERGTEVHRYWSVVGDEHPPMAEAEAVAELRKLLADAVESRLEAEVPLGAFLSGGLDSTTVVSLMARAMNRPVQTFSIGFEEAAYNEADDAREVARLLGTDHTDLIVRPDVDQLVEDIILLFDEPFGDASAIPTYLVAQLAAERVTVALSGDGGDELFGGYTRYQEVLNRTEIPRWGRAPLRALGRSLPFGFLGRNRLLDLGRSRHGRYATTVALPAAIDDGGVMRSDLAARVGTLENALSQPFHAVAHRDFATQMMLVDAQTYLPGDILTKVDRTSMAVSLEARVPLLDHHLVEFTMGLPGSLKFRQGTSKWLFREAAKGIVPPAVLTKPKQGFAVPLGDWFRRELRHRVDALTQPALGIDEFIDPDATRRIAAEHLAGRRNHQGLLWRIMVLNVWMSGLESGALAQSPREWTRGVPSIQPVRENRAP